MKTGTYRENGTDFSLYTADVFRPHLFNSSYADFGCGPCTLSLLTGLPPSQAATKVNPLNTPDDKLLQVLEKYGIEHFGITKCEMTNDPVLVRNQITELHVLLVSQLWRRNEASWGVMYDNIFYHNFRPCGTNVLDFVNRPILSAYVLFNPTWKLTNIPRFL